MKISKKSKNIVSKILGSDNVVDLIQSDTIKKNVILIDELEAIMSSNEKKCIAELQKLNSTLWHCPILFISNNTHNKLLNDIKKGSTIINFSYPTNQEFNKLFNNIKSKENIKILNNYVSDKIINHCQNDMRRLITVLQDLKEIYESATINHNAINQYCDTSKKKDIDIDLFRATENIMYKYTCVNDCFRYYEMEKALLPLMVHQNYISCIIKKVGPEKEKYKVLNEISQSMSFGDVIENYIYSDQNWNLQELHGFYTCTIPSYSLHNSSLKGLTINMKFATDLNRTSIKRINKKNIVNSNKCFINMNITDYIYLSKIVKKFLLENNIQKCVELLKSYDLELSHIELLLKIDKINGKVSLNPKQKKEFEKYLGKKD